MIGLFLWGFARADDAKPAPESRRKYCKMCGSSISYDAVYCPNCGAAQEAQAVVPETARPRGGIAEAIVEMRHIRLTLFLISLAIFIFTFILGSSAHLSPQDAQAIISDYQNTIGARPTAIEVFGNNVILCLLSFIPVFGTAFMALVGYSTGIFLAALPIVNPSYTSSLTLAFTTLILPWAWMEFTAYSLASSAGLMMIVSALRRTLRKDVRKLLIALAVSVALLALGAFLEGLAIAMAT